MNGSDEKKFRDPALIDFGDGRRLERFGGLLVDRPLPQSRDSRQLPALWTGAAARYSGSEWLLTGSLPQPWQVEVPLQNWPLSLEVRPAPSGQIGLFLEQVEQWQWLNRVTPSGSRILSLFAHAGAATLAMAAAGAEVVHVDASRQAIALARRNAKASGLTNAVVRWVCEDARTFVQRQLRRGTHYTGVVLDPPSWGHGPKGQAFAIDRDLVPLLTDIATLLVRPDTVRQAATDNAQHDHSAPAGPILLTCHTPDWHHRRLHDTLASLFHRGRTESGLLTCTDAAGRTLQLGGYARQAPTQ